MTRRILTWVFYTLAIACAVSLVVSLIHDRMVYDPQLDSAPFRAFILGRIIMFAIPGIVFAIIGLMASGRVRTFLSK